MLAQKEQLGHLAEKKDRDIEKTVKMFIHACLDNGIEINKGFGLLGELITLIEQGNYNEEVWQGLMDKAVAEARTYKEGVAL